MSQHNEVMKSMKEMAEKFAGLGVRLELPPASNKAMSTEYTEMDAGKSLTARFPFNPAFTNPVKLFQGGFLCAAFDEVMGPLTYMAAGQPAVTLDMNTSFVRPFTAKDEYIEIKAEIVSKTKTVLFVRAEAKNKEGKLVATAVSHSLVISEANLRDK